MKPKSFLKTASLLVCAGALLLACISCGRHQKNDAGELVIDLQAADDGSLVDKSPLKRDLSLAKTARAEGGVALQGDGAVQINFDAKDPVFERGPFTWMMRFKLSHPAKAEDNTVILGWNNPESGQFVAGLILQQRQMANNRSFSFLASPSGSKTDTRGALIEQPLPENIWLTVAVTYVPSKKMSVYVIAPDASVLQQGALEKDVPQKMSATEAPLTVGAPANAGLIISRVRCWNRVFPVNEMLLQSIQ